MPKRMCMRLGAALAVSAVLATACSGGEPTAEPAAGDQPGSEQAWPEMTIRLATIYQDPLTEAAAMQRFADAVEERTEGAITFETTFGTTLGSQDEINELLINGALDMALHGAPPSEEYVGLYIPYAIKDADHLLRVVQSEVGDEWSAAAEEQNGVVVNQVWSRGLRHVYLREPAESYEDLQGRRIRVAEIDGLITAVEGWNAEPVVMAFSELFTSLAAGAVDGAENTLGQIIAEKHNEVTCCVLKTAHSVSAVFWISNAGWWNGLDEQVADMLREELVATAEWATEQNLDAEEAWQSELEGLGMTVVEPPSMEPFYEGAERVGAGDLAESTWGSDAWATIQGLEEGS